MVQFLGSITQQAEKQLDEINFIQRLAHGREVNLYRRSWIGQIRETAYPFQNVPKGSEWCLGRLLHRTETACEFWAVGGALFSLLFTINWKEIEWSSSDFTCFASLPTGLKSSEKLNSNDISSLHELYNKIVITEHKSSTQSQSVPSWIYRDLPEDYLLAAESLNGKICRWTFFGLQVRHVVDETQDYYVLAESEQGDILAYLKEIAAENSYVLVREGHVVAQFGTNFCDSIHKLASIEECD